MKVKVIGKAFVSGTSKKTGKDYAATVVHVSYPSPDVQGGAVESLWVSPGLAPVNQIQLGAVYNVDRDGRGYVVGFDLVK